MKLRSTLAPVLFAALTTGAAAQMADFSIVPDFTGTDLNGQTHNLYNYLDQGYTVIVDVSATWCGPCWSYHNQHHLANLYNNYGPNSSVNKVIVLFVEGDAATTLGNLNGQSGGGGTQGNWVNGTPYPIIDDASIGDLLEITYFPTIYRICPNRMIKEVGAITTAQLWTACQECQQKYETGNSINDAALLPSQGAMSACRNSPVTLSTRLQNIGSTPLTNATIRATVAGNVVAEQAWTGNLETYEVADVQFGEFTPTSASTNVAISVVNVDDNANNNNSSTSITASNQVMPGIAVDLELMTDNYGTETSWKLTTTDGTVVAQNAGTLAANTTYNHTFNLDDQTCYVFKVFDAYGDGMCCNYGNGYFHLNVNGQTIISGGQFTSVSSKPFRTDMNMGVAENDLINGLVVAPNPTNGLVRMEFSSTVSDRVAVEVYDMVGSLVMRDAFTVVTGRQVQELDLGALANGVYNVALTVNGSRTNTSVVVSK